MLLTFRDIAHIPSKLSIFYDQAYESLFQKHDALKGGFQRDRQTELDIQDFARVFSAFCVQSYDERRFAFTHSQALRYFDQARNISSLEFDSEGVLQDSMQAVCLMIEDGLEIGFAHRSFQEFFVARFISSSPPETKGKLIERFAQSGEVDEVMQLLFEMDQYAVEEHYLLPAIEKIKALVQFKKTVGVTHWLRYLKVMYSHFHMLQGDGETPPHLMATIKDTYMFHVAAFANRVYACAEEEDGKASIARIDEVRDVFREEYGEEGRVSLGSLRTTDRFFRALKEHPNLWGLGALQRIIWIGELIEKRRRESQSTLDAILSTPPQKRLLRNSARSTRKRRS